MTQFFEETYGGQEDLFFEKTLFVCDTFDNPLATCASWLAYGKFQTIHWFKTLKAYEGQGLGRALLSIIMTRFESTDYPIFLHTQTGSFRAIKLYADFGFKLLQGTSFGSRNHYLDQYLPVLKKRMPAQDFGNLKTIDAPDGFIAALHHETRIQF